MVANLRENLQLLSVEMRFRPLVAIVAAATLLFSQSGAVPPRPIQHTWNGDLTLDQAIKLALKQNPNVLKALWQIENTRGQIIEVRAEALPHVALTSSYFQQSKSLLQGRGGSTTSGIPSTCSSTRRRWRLRRSTRKRNVRSARHSLRFIGVRTPTRSGRPMPRRTA